MALSERNQQLYLLQMSVQATRTHILLQLDALEAEIEKLIPEKKTKRRITRKDWRRELAEIRKRKFGEKSP